jgi:hypothetical protein
MVINLGRTTEFHKTTPAYSKRTTCLEFAEVDGVLVACNHVLFWPFGFWEGVVKLDGMLPSWGIPDTENEMEGDN